MLTAIVIQIAVLGALVGLVVFIAVSDKRTQQARQREDKEEAQNDD